MGTETEAEAGRAWGPWRLEGDVLTGELSYVGTERGAYHIALDHYELGEFPSHIAMKTWGTPDVVWHLCRALHETGAIYRAGRA